MTREEYTLDEFIADMCVIPIWEIPDYMYRSFKEQYEEMIGKEAEE